MFEGILCFGIELQRQFFYGSREETGFCVVLKVAAMERLYFRKVVFHERNGPGTAGEVGEDS